jgi:hypothetical protein
MSGGPNSCRPTIISTMDDRKSAYGSRERFTTANPLRTCSSAADTTGRNPSQTPHVSQLLAARR